MVEFWPAYLTIAIVLGVLVLVLYLRAKEDGDIATKKDISDLKTDIKSQTQILEKILEVLKQSGKGKP